MENKGTPLVVPKDLEKGDYEKRKKAFLNEAQLLEKKYKVKLGAELRVFPTGIAVFLVTYDMTKVKKPAKSSN